MTNSGSIEKENAKTRLLIAIFSAFGRERAQIKFELEAFQKFKEKLKSPTYKTFDIEDAAVSILSNRAFAKISAEVLAHQMKVNSKDILNYLTAKTGWMTQEAPLGVETPPWIKLQGSTIKFNLECLDGFKRALTNDPSSNSQRPNYINNKFQDEFGKHLERLNLARLTSSVLTENCILSVAVMETLALNVEKQIHGFDADYLFPFIKERQGKKHNIQKHFICINDYINNLIDSKIIQINKAGNVTDDAIREFLLTRWEDSKMSPEALASQIVQTKNQSPMAEQFYKASLQGLEEFIRRERPEVEQKTVNLAFTAFNIQTGEFKAFAQKYKEHITQRNRKLHEEEKLLEQEENTKNQQPITPSATNSEAKEPQVHTQTANQIAKNEEQETVMSKIPTIEFGSDQMKSAATAIIKGLKDTNIAVKENSDILNSHILDIGFALAYKEILLEHFKKIATISQKVIALYHDHANSLQPNPMSGILGKAQSNILKIKQYIMLREMARSEGVNIDFNDIINLRHEKYADQGIKGSAKDAIKTQTTSKAKMIALSTAPEQIIIDMHKPKAFEINAWRELYVMVFKALKAKNITVEKSFKSLNSEGNIYNEAFNNTLKKNILYRFQSLSAFGKKVLEYYKESEVKRYQGVRISALLGRNKNEILRVSDIVIILSTFEKIGQPLTPEKLVESLETEQQSVQQTHENAAQLEQQVNNSPQEEIAPDNKSVEEIDTAQQASVSVDSRVEVTLVELLRQAGLDLNKPIKLPDSSLERELEKMGITESRRNKIIGIINKLVSLDEAKLDAITALV